MSLPDATPSREPATEPSGPTPVAPLHAVTDPRTDTGADTGAALNTDPDPDRPRFPWADARLVNVNPTSRLLVAGGKLLILLAAVVSIDTVLLKALIALQLDVPTGWAWAMALGIGAVMLLPGFDLGVQWRTHRATGERLDPTFWIYLGAWLILVAVLFGVRATATATATVAIPGLDTPAGSDHHLVQAFLLLGVQLLTGLTAFFLAAQLTNPEASALWTALRRQKRIHRRLPTAEKQHARLSHNVAARVAVLDQVAAAATTARQLQLAMGEHVKASARVRIAQLLGKPGDTTTVIDG